MSARMLCLVSRSAPTVLALAALLLPAADGYAIALDPITAVWSSGAGANGHTYTFVPLEHTVTWSQANAAAEGSTLVPGSVDYLATITSQQEQAFVQNSVLPPSYVGVNKNQVWLGAVQEPEEDLGETDPSDGWTWIVNTEVAPEGWDYSNWSSEGEPNNDSGRIDERFLTMWVHYYKNARDLRGTWNDSHDDAGETAWIIGMIVESSPATVPEPGSAALSALGVGLLARRLLRRR